MSISRNIVILGKVGSGKRTLGYHIVGGDMVFKRETVLGAGNVGAHYGQFSRGSTSYCILTIDIDTENFQTGYDNLAPYIQQRLQEIHLIIFTTPYGLETDESLGLLMHAIQNLDQQVKSISALVITHCEKLTDAIREAIIAIRSSKVETFVQHGTYAVGFPDLSTLTPEVKPAVQNAISKDEETIRKLVEQCKVPLSAKSHSGLDVKQYYSSSAATALPSEVMHKKPSSPRMINDPERPLIELEPQLPATKTPANADLGSVSQPKTPVREGLSASRPKTPDKGFPRPRIPERQPGYRPSPLATDLQRQAIAKKPCPGTSPKYHQQRAVTKPDHEYPLVDLRPTLPARKTSVHDGPLAGADSQPKTPGKRPNTPERQLENQSRQLRNVVILGKAGSGKRTLGNHIVGSDIFKRETALGTRNVGAHFGESTRGDTFYRILTVDTESLQTDFNNPIPEIQQKFDEIHSIIFVIPHGRYTDESHWSLMHAVESLHRQSKSVSSLVITHCEGMTDEQRRSVISEFSTDARSSQVVGFMQRGTYAVGFPDLSTLPPNVKPILQNVIERDEKAVRKLMERCDVPLSAKILPELGTQQPFYRHSASEAIKTQAREGGDFGGLRQFISNNCNVL